MRKKKYQTPLTADVDLSLNGSLLDDGWDVTLSNYGHGLVDAKQVTWDEDEFNDEQYQWGDLWDNQWDDMLKSFNER